MSRVWDLPTRVMHAALAVAAVVAFATGEPVDGGRAHVVAGSAVAAVVAARVVWGFAGERWSRWRHVAAGSPGHTRSAAASAVTALAVAAALSATGAIVLGGEEGRGLLAGVVGPAWGVSAHKAHAALAWLGVGWLAVHLAGVARQSWKERQNLVGSMITGRKRTGEPSVAPRSGAALTLLAALAAGVGAAGSRPAGGSAPVGVAVDPVWTRECGDCHFAYPPPLLPRAAWDSLLAPGADHFGEVLGLDAQTAAALGAFAAAHAAEAGETEFAVRVAGEGAAGPRISDTDAWRAAHEAVPAERFTDPAVRSASRCGACHPDAAQGAFDARAVERPRETRARAAVAAGRSS